jgi:hypothetical protein
MYNSEDTKWFNQVLMTYKDSRYGTDGYLRLSSVTSTQDFKLFNQTNLALSITNNIQKNCTFQHHNCIRLIKSFEQFIEGLKAKQPFEATITQKIKEQQLHFIFFVGNNEPLVKIQIISNETDMVGCIIPFFDKFESFLKILKQYTENYILYSNTFIQTSLMTTAIEAINQIPVLIRSSLAQISSGIVAPVRCESVAPEVIEESSKTEMTIKDLDKFLGEGMKNIKVPEIDENKIEEKTEVKPSEINSILVDKVLKWELKNLENMLAGYVMSPFPIEEFANRILTDSNLDFNPLSGLTDDDRKSLLYISKMTHQTLDKLATEAGQTIPSGFNILKYKTINFSETNVEIAFDLLLIGGFIRCFRRKMEEKLSARTRESTGINFHLNFRMITDPFVFSFLDNIDKNQIKSVIVNRYKYFDQKDLFKHYKIHLSDHNAIPIDVTDIEWYVSEIIEKVINQGPYIDEMHKTEYEKGTLKLPPKNTLNREQIINELIPLEVGQKFGKEVDPNTLADKSVVELFDKKAKPKVEKTVDPDRNNLLRLIKQHENQIPERFREEFLKKIEDYGNKNFVIDDSYPYQEFGEDVVKLLHLWKPEDDDKLSKNFKYFSVQFAEMIHTKETILSLGNTKSKSSFDDMNW